MKKKVQQAIIAARAGELIQSQSLLADVLKEDHDDVQAWFLLSNVVDSESHRDAYLYKVLEIDPTYEPALQQMAGTDEEEPIVPAQTTEVLDELTPLTADEDDLLLAAMMTSNDNVEMSADDFVAEETAVSDTQPIADVATIEADRLPPTVETDAILPHEQAQQAFEEAPTVETEAVAPEKTKTAVVKQPEKEPKTKKAEPAPLTGTLYLLIALAALVTLAIIYLLFF